MTLGLVQDGRRREKVGPEASLAAWADPRDSGTLSDLSFLRVGSWRNIRAGKLSLLLEEIKE